MQKLTIQQIKVVIEKNKLQKFFYSTSEDDKKYWYWDDINIPEEFYTDLLNEESDIVEAKTIEKGEQYLDSLGLRNFELIEIKCNNEEFYAVIYFKDENGYIKITGEYDSYGEYDHDYDNEVKIVKPQEKTIISYDEII